MIGEIVVNGISSKNYNVFLSDAGVYGMPERDTQTVQIDGRSGDLIIDKERYKNKTTEFPCIIVDDFDVNYSAFIGFLLAQRGYTKIETSFRPNEYIYGRYVGAVDPKVSNTASGGTFVIKFDRKPQRYLKEGDIPIVLTANGALFNHYSGVAKPLVRVYGTGTVNISGTTITINSVDSYVDIDCELQDAYKGSTNCNGNITLNSDKFFELQQGGNAISISSGISRIEITPRWWKL